MEKNKIIIKNARENNLKNISLVIPKNKIIIFTGVSGSGKSSLAFKTIYSEGHRRYVESLSTYTRQFLGNIEKAKVDSIEGLSPAISIDQKTSVHSPRSTVGTTTEIYDYLRLLFAKVGVAHCIYNHGKIQSVSISEMIQFIFKKFANNSQISIFSPLVKKQKGSFKQLLASLKANNYRDCYIDGKYYDLFKKNQTIELEKAYKHTIKIKINTHIIEKNDQEFYSELFEDLEQACKLSKGIVEIEQNKKIFLFSQNQACVVCGYSLSKIEPRLFSFNSPIGACETCLGIGYSLEINFEQIFDFNLSINEGGIKRTVYGMKHEGFEWQKLVALCNFYDIPLDVKIKDLTKEQVQRILDGSNQPIKFNLHLKGNEYKFHNYITGIGEATKRKFRMAKSNTLKKYYKKFLRYQKCHQCQGKRLSKKALFVFINNYNIIDLTNLSLNKCLEFFQNLKLSELKVKISQLVIKEITARLKFLLNVGLKYLTLSRSTSSLSGGELQRIRLATQMGSKLSGVLYILDEPSIGLHQKDNAKLISMLKQLRDLQNTIIVVEHDEETILSGDWIVDLGLHAGKHGGEIIFNGLVKDIFKNKISLTAQYLNKTKQIAIPETRSKGNNKFLTIVNARENNLKNLNLKIPLHQFVCVCGVSGSGKSTLINQILYRYLKKYLHSEVEAEIGKVDTIKGLENIDKVINVSQDPIGKTPRSNPATYTSVFNDIRDLFETTTLAKIKGYKKGRFSFNVKGGRCEKCQGGGVLKIEMHFLPNVYVVCDQCHGKRFNEETLQVKFKNHNIYDVLDLTINQALVLFQNQVKIFHKLKIIHDVGLGYIKLGQPATELSGGEAQRIKLATFLQKKATGKTLFLLDEPTTGLHINDIKKLLKILHRIVNNGDSVLVIEHNLEVIKTADHVIDLGPEGGDEGGYIVAQGTPEDVSLVKQSYTGQYLKKIFDEDKRRSQKKIS